MSERHRAGIRARVSTKRIGHAARGGTLAAITLLAAAAPAAAQSPNGVKTLSPRGAIKPTGTWDVAARAGDFVFIAACAGSIPQPTPSFQATKHGFAKPSST
jgi:hypothetical protein